MAIFRLEKWDRLDKDAFISVVDCHDLRLTVDTDDVDDFEMATALEKMLRILNDHWLDAEYTTLGPTGTLACELGDCPEDDRATNAYWERRREASREIMRRLSKGTSD